MIRTVTLGDREVARVGLGTNRLTNSAESRAFLEAAVGGGLQHIDTAHVYTSGESERTIGEALAPFGGELVVATKGAYEEGGGAGKLQSQLEESLERLGVETIDLYYLHRVQPDLPLAEAMRILADHRDAGRIRQIGLSAVTVEQIERAREVVEIAAVQNHYNLTERKYDDVLDHCEREGIVFVPYYPLKGEDPPGLAEIAARHDATPNQIRLAWHLRRSPAVAPIPGTRSLEHLRENLAALEIELDDEGFEALGG